MLLLLPPVLFLVVRVTMLWIQDNGNLRLVRVLVLSIRGKETELRDVRYVDRAMCVPTCTWYLVNEMGFMGSLPRAGLTHDSTSARLLCTMDDSTIHNPHHTLLPGAFPELQRK